MLNVFLNLLQTRVYNGPRNWKVFFLHAVESVKLYLIRKWFWWREGWVFFYIRVDENAKQPNDSLSPLMAGLFISFSHRTRFARDWVQPYCCNVLQKEPLIRAFHDTFHAQLEINPPVTRVLSSAVVFSYSTIQMITGGCNCNTGSFKTQIPHMTWLVTSSCQVLNFAVLYARRN